MLNYNQALKETKLYSDLEMSEIKPLMKLILRGKVENFICNWKITQLLLPTESNTSTTSQDLTALWLSPDEWMIYSNEISSENSNIYPIEES